MSVCRWIVLFAFCILASTTSRAAAADGETESADAEVSYLAPESFASRGVGDDFIAYAKGFLDEHPQHTAAARCAFDLLIAATLRRDAALLDFASAKLAFDYSASPPTVYWLTTLGQQSAQYKAFLQKHFENMAPTLDAESGLRFCRAVELGARNWGPTFLEGDEFLLQLALAAEASNNLSLKLFCQERFKTSRKPASEIAAISLDKRAAIAKFVELGKFVNEKSARWHQDYYRRQLSKTDLERPDVRRVIATSYLREFKYGEALPIIESLLDEAPDDELLYWQAWCLASKGQDPAALAALARLHSRYPESLFAPAATELSTCLSSLAPNVARHAEAMNRVVEGLRAKSFERLEAEFTYAPRSDLKVDIYLAVDKSDGETFELVIERNEATILAFHSSPAGARVFGEGDVSIQQYGSGVYLLSTLALTPAAGNLYQFTYNWRLHDAPGGAEAAVQSLLSSPFLASKDSVAALIRSAASRGSFPAAVREGKSLRHFDTLTPRIDSHELARDTFAIDAQGKLASFNLGAFTCTKLRYGKAAEVEFAGAKWPERLPISEHEQFDPAASMRFLAAAAGLMQNIYQK